MSAIRLIDQGALWGTLSLVFVMACSSNPTQVIVEIDADEEVRGAVDEVRLEVFARTGVDEEGDPLFEERVFLGSRGVSAWPLRHVLTPRGQDPSREYLVVASGINSARETVSESRVQSGYLAETTAIVQLHLYGGACLGVVCNKETTCRRGSGLCLGIPVVIPVPQGVDASMPDAGPDVPEMDAGPDAPNTCVDGVECELGSALPCAEPMGRIRCEGDLAICEPQALRLNTVCNASEEPNPCDPDDVCDGETFGCEAVVLPDLAECGDGNICIGNECQPCVPDVVCTTNMGCQEGTITCTGGVAACVNTTPVGGVVECRAANGEPCDAPEYCLDGECPVGAVVPAADALECRASEGDCDLPEVCDGVGSACPSDVFNVGNECSPLDIDGCLEASFCGTGADCPAAIHRTAGTLCRGAIGECDIAEICGDTGPCPDDEYESATTECEGGAALCDGVGNCSMCNAHCVLPDDPCRAGTFVCNGSGGIECIVEPVLDGTTCTAPGEPTSCDQPTSSCRSGTCEFDTRDSGADCTPSGADLCERHSCDGHECVPGFESASHVCQARSFTACLDDSFCTGSGGACPPATFFNGERCGPDLGCSVFQCESSGCREVPSSETRTCDLGSLGECEVGMCDGDGACHSIIVTGAACEGGGTCSEEGECIRAPVFSEILSNGMRPGSYIELYNPAPEGTEAYDLSGCVVRVFPTCATAPSTGFTLDAALEPFEYFLISDLVDLNPDFHSTSMPITPGRGQVTLRCGGALIDGLRWGACGGAPPIPFMPAIGGGAPLPPPASIERKACESSTTSSMEEGGVDHTSGNAWDTGAGADFVQRSISLDVPQHSGDFEQSLCGSS